ncbi:polysaccharide biosynthesis protein [Vibrio algicola]|uniref:NAD-dependent epimerase/dehydratase family protein n=1 Tax=Vibrio algicola TaxID=2662262 RepID=A0A5Q0TDL8_9VIBR|nr:nucleoside-diphosphate sugar epimerase/dehydratase [Vibrio algicola]
MIKLNYIWSLSRFNKRIISLIIDAFFVTLAFVAAYWARLGHTHAVFQNDNLYVLLATLAVTLLCFTKLGLYRAILRYLTFHALFVVSVGTIISGTTVAICAFYLDAYVPRSIPIIYSAFLCLMCGGSRLIVRVLVSQQYTKGLEPVLIYGAGSSGRQLAIALRSSSDYRVRAFVDNDKTLQNTVIQGLTVNKPKNIQYLIKRYNIKKILLALPSATRSQRKEIIDTLVPYPVEVLTVPAMSDIVSGKATIDQLSDVPIEDLLGREAVMPQKVLLELNIKNKVVMVTGAGGSIGSELCRQIIQQKPKALVLFELSEFALYKIDKELSTYIAENGLSIPIYPLLGSVQRINRLATAMKHFSVETVYHAAAYKHVPMVEYNVVEGIRNNIFGTYYSAKAAIEAGVKSFVLISTDKAVRPTNVMGTTKRIAELGLQALAQEEAKKEHGTDFCMVRFGNVLGSSGSVIPLFKRQIEQGGPLTVTHPDIIRYFMTIPEAAQLVIQAGAMARGGDVFVLDMGEPVRITDLAENLIHLSGLEVKSESNPHGDIEIQFTGLRPGEKLYEELLIGNDVSETSHERIMTASEVCISSEEYQRLLEQLDKACHDFDHDLIREILINTPAGFTPSDGISDLVWKQRVMIEDVYPK